LLFASGEGQEIFSLLALLVARHQGHREHSDLVLHSFLEVLSTFIVVNVDLFEVYSKYLRVSEIERTFEKHKDIFQIKVRHNEIKDTE